MDGKRVVGILSKTDLLRLLIRDEATIAREAMRRLADLPGRWTARVSQGVLTLTGNGQPA